MFQQLILILLLLSLLRNDDNDWHDCQLCDQTCYEQHQI